MLSTNNPYLKLADKYTLTNGTFYFYKNFIISEVHKGIELSIKNSTQLLELIDRYFDKEKPFIYITNRINSYSFTPTSHFELADMFPNGKGYAIVIHDALNNKIGRLEQTFLEIPSEIFYSLDDAIEWGKDIISNN